MVTFGGCKSCDVDFHRMKLENEIKYFLVCLILIIKNKLIDFIYNRVIRPWKKL